MNKKKFERQLKAIKKNGSFSLYFINSLFKEEKTSLFNNEKIETLIANNFSTIMSYAGRGNIDSFIDTLYAYKTMKPFMEKSETIKHILDTVAADDFELIINDSSINKLAQTFIHDNFDYILNNYPTTKIISIYEHMKLNEQENAKIDQYFNNKKKEFLKETLTKTLSLKGNLDKTQLNTLLGIVEKVVDTALNQENAKITDIKILESGSFSNVLKIKDTIIKVGIPRKTFNIPNDKRILQPHLRRDLTNDFGIEATIEVCNRVDTNISLNEDQLYAIYKDMRNRGVVCGDFKYDNIGRLLKPNKPNNNPDNGLIGEVKETLDVGDYVIIDTDFIYNEDDPNLTISSHLSTKFESRYKKEYSNTITR